MSIRFSFHHADFWEFHSMRFFFGKRPTSINSSLPWRTHLQNDVIPFCSFTLFSIDVFFIQLFIWNTFSTLQIGFVLGQKNPISMGIYNDAKGVLESRTKLIHTIMLRVAVPVIVLQFILWSFIQYIRSDFSNDSFHLIYPYA